MTMPRETADNSEKNIRHAQLLREMAELFDYTYVIDLNAYAQIYDRHFRKRYYLNGHMNPAGYLLTARMIESYIDYIVRHNPEQFYQVGLIRTEDYDNNIP